MKRARHRAALLGARSRGCCRRAHAEDIKLAKKQRAGGRGQHAARASPTCAKATWPRRATRSRRRWTRIRTPPTTQMAAGFVYDRLGDDEQGRVALRAGGEARRQGQPATCSTTPACSSAARATRSAARQYFLQAAESPLYRTPEVAYTNAGRCARADGRPKDAEQYFRKALAIKPNQRRRAVRRWRSSRTTPATTCRRARSSSATRRRRRCPRRRSGSATASSARSATPPQAAQYARRSCSDEFADVDRDGPAVRSGTGAASDAARSARSPSCRPSPGARLRAGARSSRGSPSSRPPSSSTSTRPS